MPLCNLPPHQIHQLAADLAGGAGNVMAMAQNADLWPQSSVIYWR
jgi:hypothetical protein